MKQSIKNKLDFEIENYIDKSKNKRFPIADQFKVYVMDVKKANNDSIEFLLTYIMNSRDYKNLFPTHYILKDTNYVLVKISADIDISDVGFLFLKKISQMEFKIVQRLYPSVVGECNYTPNVLRYQNFNNHEKIIMYEHPGQVPKKYNFWLNRVDLDQFEIYKRK